jgi:hypothetical protein
MPQVVQQREQANKVQDRCWDTNVQVMRVGIYPKYVYKSTENSIDIEGVTILYLSKEGYESLPATRDASLVIHGAYNNRLSLLIHLTSCLERG